MLKAGHKMPSQSREKNLMVENQAVRAESHVSPNSYLLKWEQAVRFK